MSDIADMPRKRRPRFRRWRYLLVASACLLALGVGSWFVFQRYLHVERYRPLLEEQIREATGLPTSIGELSLVLRPLPALHVDKISVGEAGFAVQAEQAVISVDVGQLLERTFHVTGIELRQLRAVAPSAPAILKQKINELKARFSRPKSGTLTFNVDSIVAKECALYLDQNDHPTFSGDLEFRDVFSKTPSGTVKAEVVALGERVDTQGDIQIIRGPGNAGIQSIKGSFGVDGLDLTKIADKTRLPRVELDIEGTIRGSGPQSLGIKVAGRVEPAKGAKAFDKLLEGPFTADAVWDGSALHLNDVRWNADGLRLAGEATRSDTGDWTVSAPSAVVGRATMNALFARINGDSFAMASARDARINVTDLNVVVPAGKPFELRSGRIEFRGVDLNLKKTKDTKDLFHNLSGRAVLSGGAVTVEEITGSGFTISGTATPNFETKQATVNLAGKMELNRERLTAFIPVGFVKQAKGALELGRIDGTFGAGVKGMPPDLVVEGVVRDGALAIATGNYNDRLSAVDGAFKLEKGAVAFDTGGQSSSMGPLKIAGTYQLSTKTWESVLQADLGKAVSPFLKNEGAKRVVPPILAAYGESTFSVVLKTPFEKSPGSVRLVRQGEPALQVAAGLGKKADKITFGDIEGSANVPLTALRHILTDNVQAEGIVPLEFRRVVKEGRFIASSDLTSADIVAGPYLHKRPGTASTIQATGEASDKTWSAQELQFSVAGQTVVGRWSNDRLVFSNLDLDMAKLVPLLPNGAAATGRITGSAATAPGQASVRLREVGFTYKPGIPIDSINGNIDYLGGRLALRDLSFRGANSEAVLNMTREGGAWQGSLRAKQLDINTIDQVRKAAAGETAATTTADDKPAAKSSRFRGRVDAVADKVIYRRAELSEVKTTLVGDGETIRLENLSAKPRSGVATGTVSIGQSEAYPWIVEGTLDLDSVHASLVDELIFAEPRGFAGALTGKIRFSVPIPRHDRPINVASAEVELAGKDGSFGKLGLATKILNVLRATEIFRLRLPSLRDEGLTYDKATFLISMKDGVMNVKKVELSRPSFALTADGTVDFPKDSMHLGIGVFPLQTITGVVEKVPLIGQAMSEIRKMGPIGLKAEGSPFDPKVTLEAFHYPEAVKNPQAVQSPEATGSERDDSDPSQIADNGSGTSTDASTSTEPSPDAKPGKGGEKGAVKEVTGAAKRVLKGILGQ